MLGRTRWHKFFLSQKRGPKALAALRRSFLLAAKQPLVFSVAGLLVGISLSRFLYIFYFFLLFTPL